MVSFRPFRAVLPNPKLAHKVVTRPFDSYGKEEVGAVLLDSEFSFLHVIVPVAKEIGKKTLSPEERLHLGKKELEQLFEIGALTRANTPAYYIYRQTDTSGHVFTGIMGAASVHDYKHGAIKKHEATLEYKEVLLKEYLEVIDIHAEPVYLTVPDNEHLQHILEKGVKNDPAISVRLHGILHEIWPVDDANDIKEVEIAFAETESMYIADGHHRCASSALYGTEKMKQNKNHTGHEAYNGFLAVVIPESGAKLYEFSRLVKDMGNHSAESFTASLQKEFDVETIAKEDLSPTEKHTFGLYLEGKSYRLKLKENPSRENPLENLDPQLLNERIFTPLLGITDLRKDKRVKFIGGKANISQLVKEVDGGKFKAAFLSFPVPFGQFKQIADAGLVMPPKSTWFEPKFPNALVIYPLND